MRLLKCVENNVCVDAVIITEEIYGCINGELVQYMEKLNRNNQRRSFTLQNIDFAQELDENTKQLACRLTALNQDVDKLYLLSREQKVLEEREKVVYACFPHLRKNR